MLRVDTEYVAIAAIDLTPNAIIPQGARGRVIELVPDAPGGPGVMVEWHAQFEGLRCWQNITLLIGKDVLKLRPVTAPRWRIVGLGTLAGRLLLHPVSIAANWLLTFLPMQPLLRAGGAAFDYLGGLLLW